MRVMIYGTGGVGGYYGGCLARAGCDVSFIARGEHLRAIQSGGLRVASVDGDFVIDPARATSDPAEIGPVDFVLLGVKAWQVKDAADRLRPILAAGTGVVTLQNGVESPYVVAESIGRESVMPGSVRIFSYIEGPGRIRHIGGPGTIAFGEWDNRSSPRAERLADALEGAGIPVERPADIVAALWKKFIFVVPVGIVGAISRSPIGVLRQMPETRELLEEAMSEIALVAQARGVHLPEGIVASTMALMAGLPPGGTSSLQRDIAAGRPSELGDWAGAVVRLGEESGVPVPLHRHVYHGLLPLERRARGEVEFPTG